MMTFHEWKQWHIAKCGLVHTRDWYHAAYGQYCERYRNAL